jgi:cobalamin biosynthesis protein CobD/CbiB
MLLTRKLIILAIIIHVVTIFACASLQPQEEEVTEEPRTEQHNQLDEARQDQLKEETTSLEQ